MTEKCKAVIRGGSAWHTSYCSKPATRDGWCGTHHPEAAQRRKDKAAQRDAELNAQWEAERIARKQKIKEQRIGRLVLLHLTSGDVSVITAADIAALDSNADY
jgi:hypothetical protein